MLSAESAILFQFHSFRMSFLVLFCVVITLFAFCACQCNSRAHNFHLHKFIVCFSIPQSRCAVEISQRIHLGIKKRPTSKLFYHSTFLYSRQFFFKNPAAGLLITKSSIAGLPPVSVSTYLIMLQCLILTVFHQLLKNCRTLPFSFSIIFLCIII